MSTMERGKVIEIIDGHRVRVMKDMGGAQRGGRPEQVIVRFLGMTIGDWRGGSPIAWRSRQWLRQRIIGRDVTFQVYETVSPSEVYGYIFMVGSVGDLPDGSNIGLVMVSKGLLGLASPEGVEVPASIQEEMEKNELLAKSSSSGKWGVPKGEASAIERPGKIAGLASSTKAFETIQGREISAYVEQVLDDFTLVLFIPELKSFVSVGLFGINSDFNGLGSKYADEEKFFIEYRILNRDVKFSPLVLLDRPRRQAGAESGFVRPQGATNGQSQSIHIFGRLMMPQGDIALSLIREGFAELDYINFPKLNGQSFAGSYHETQKAAKTKEVRKWRPGQEVSIPEAPPLGASHAKADLVDTLDGGKTSWYGRVVGILRPDYFVIEPRDGDNQEGMRLYLSGLVNPLRGHEGTPMYEIPYLYDSIELLRKRYNNVAVRVVEDNVREIEKRGDAHDTWTLRQVTLYARPGSGLPAEATLDEVIQDDEEIETNAALYVECVNTEILKEGLGKIDNNVPATARSIEYESMRNASMSAIKSTRGFYSVGALQVNPKYIISDLSLPSSALKANAHFSQLAAIKDLRGYVEEVNGCDRFKIRLLKENVVVYVKMNDVVVPFKNRPGQAEGSRSGQFAARSPEAPLLAPYYNILSKKLRKALLYKTVKVKLHAKQKGGCYIGHVTTINDFDIAKWSVENGYAAVSAYSRNDEYIAAYKQAQKKRLNFHAQVEQAEIGDATISSKVDAILLEPLTELMNGLKTEQPRCTGPGNGHISGHDEEDPVLGTAGEEPSLQEMGGVWAKKEKHPSPSATSTRVTKCDISMDCYQGGLNLGILLENGAKRKPEPRPESWGENRESSGGPFGNTLRQTNRLDSTIVEDCSSVCMLDMFQLMDSPRIEKFTVKVTSSEAAKIEECLTAILHKTKVAVAACYGASRTIAVGQYCLFTEGSSGLHRGTVITKDRNGAVIWSFDTGKEVSCQYDQVYPLDAASKSATVLRQMMPRYLQCRLALVKTSRNYPHEADYVFKKLLNDHPVTNIQLISFDAPLGCFHAILESTGQTTLNELLVERGYCRAGSRIANDLNEVLKKKESIAKKKRLVIWKHGAGDSD